MDQKERRAVQGPPPTACSLCGKPFGFWDTVQNFAVNDYIGYGSQYDLCRIRLHLCCRCLDRVLDWLVPQCVNNPMEEFDESDGEEESEREDG